MSSLTRLNDNILYIYGDEEAARIVKNGNQIFDYKLGFLTFRETGCVLASRGKHKTQLAIYSKLNSKRDRKELVQGAADYMKAKHRVATAVFEDGYLDDFIMLENQNAENEIPEEEFILVTSEKTSLKFTEHTPLDRMVRIHNLLNKYANEDARSIRREDFHLINSN